MSAPHESRAPRTPEDVRDALAGIAALLAPAHPSVAEEVLHAHDRPHDYVSAFEDRLDQRGIDEPVENLAWIALIDALHAHGLLAEFDWKEDAHEIRAQLEGLGSRPSADPWPLSGAPEPPLPTDAFLHACGHRYREVGAALAVLDIESDCYPVAVLPEARAQELTALAAVAGFPVQHLGTGPGGG
ncbi:MULTISPECIES: DUF6630 family protein [unclassified Streptomyces]|uniref:DUF6630 family protein n=1 Tax=unclassified Streptomyces TaxID=2593676 RepID=UPI000823BED0|nr:MULTISPECIES: DUF6630 family protein [unclassified Streptomyces]MYT99388.1 hypothetical protein [Streptomyces sp. SID8350]SCK19146.1 hypothetical protein YUWDRAFT_01279 [Streptomyces sp. AmelKG-D3]